MAAAQARRDNDNELGFMRRVSDKFVTGSVFLSWIYFVNQMNCHLIWLIFPGIAMIPWQTLHTDWEH